MDIKNYSETFVLKIDPPQKKCYFVEIDDETKENPLGLEER